MAKMSMGTAEKVVWSLVVLAGLMALMFFMLNLASKAPVVGGVASSAAPFVSGSRYGY